jgi:hypothetical protein
MKMHDRKIFFNHREQKGQVLLLALIATLFISLIVGSLLTFMSSALKQGTALERRTDQTYIADSGVESACNKILSGNIGNIVTTPYTFSLAGINEIGSSANTTITFVSFIDQIVTYEIVSQGINAYGTTQITAKINQIIGDYSSFLNNIASSNGIVDIVSASGHVELNGSIQAAGITGTPGGTWTDDGPYTGPWPTANELRSWFQYLSPPPQYHNGGWAIPNGTIFVSDQYVIGDCNFEGDVDLNGFTLFVDGNITTDPHGPGVVASTGDIETWPGENTDPNSGIFFFACGSVNFHPSANFYGWIAGYDGIGFQQGNSPIFQWVQPNPFIYELHFPGLNPTAGSGGGNVTITDWKIEHQ